MKLFLAYLFCFLSFGTRPAWALDSNQEHFKDLLTAPYSSGPMVEQELQNLNSYFLSERKHQAYFNSIYIIITQGILHKIEQQEFENPRCIEKMLITFSNLYRQALFHYYFGEKEKTPLPWQMAFKANDLKKTKATVQLVLGMNAHIVHDLAITLDQVARRDASCSLNRVEKDYFELNQFFHEKILELNLELQKVYSVVTNNSDKSILKPINILAVKNMIILMRAKAWESANHLNQLNSLEDYKKYLRVIDRESYLNTRAIFKLEFLFPSRGL